MAELVMMEQTTVSGQWWKILQPVNQLKPRWPFAVVLFQSPQCKLASVVIS